jgi:hypothetical protein
MEMNFDDERLLKRRLVGDNTKQGLFFGVVESGTENQQWHN